MFVVGKYTLESLTNGMYSSPLDLYREYIQNAVDSIDDAVRSGLVEKKNSHIHISVNTETASISIKDNGCGISKENVYTSLDEYSWVDYANYKEGPMFIFQICDVVSGKILEEKTYKSVGRLRNRIEKFIKTSTVDDGVITYNGQTCSVILNGIDISEYRMNAENIDLFLHTYSWESTVIYSVTVEGLF